MPGCFSRERFSVQGYSWNIPFIHFRSTYFNFIPNSSNSFHVCIYIYIYNYCSFQTIVDVFSLKLFQRIISSFLLCHVSFYLSMCCCFSNVLFDLFCYHHYVVLLLVFSCCFFNYRFIELAFEFVEYSTVFFFD